MFHHQYGYLPVHHEPSGTSSWQVPDCQCLQGILAPGGRRHDWMTGTDWDRGQIFEMIAMGSIMVVNDG